MTDAEALGIVRLGVAECSGGDAAKIAEFDRLLDRFSVAVADPANVSDGMRHAAALVLAERILPRMARDEGLALLGLFGVDAADADSVSAAHWSFVLGWLDGTRHSQRAKLRILWLAVDAALRIVFAPPLPGEPPFVRDDRHQVMASLTFFEMGLVSFGSATQTQYELSDEETQLLAKGLAAIRSIMAAIDAKTAS